MTQMNTDSLSLSSIIHDLKLGFGALLKRPAFATVVVLALAIGIGGNTAIFSVENALLIRPLPYENADDLVWIRETNARSGVMDETVSPTNFLDWKDRNESFADMAAVTGGFATVTTNGEPERLFVSFVTANYFSVLGVRTRIGRTFEAGEAAPGKNQVVVLSAGFDGCSNRAFRITGPHTIFVQFAFRRCSHRFSYIRSGVNTSCSACVDRQLYPGTKGFPS